MRGVVAGVKRDRVIVDTGRDTLVQQQFGEEVDINTIIKRFGLTGPPVYHEGVYGDFTGITDFASAAQAVRRAEENFMRLPAAARDRFGNDPGRFFEYANSVTEEQLIEYCGLRLAAEPVKAPVVEAVVTPPVMPTA